MMPRAARTTRRGFTMIELVLAMVLGLFIVGAVFAMFAVLRACEDRSRMRADGLHELATLQDTLTKSLRTLVVLDKPIRTAPRREGGAASGGASGGASAGGSAGASGGKSAGSSGSETGGAAGAGEANGVAAQYELPRLLLEQSGLLNKPRLEMVMSGSPLALKLSGNEFGAGSFVDAEDGGGVRAAFELEPGERPDTWDVWLRAYDLEEPPGPERMPIGQTRVCKGLVALDVKFWKSGTRDDIYDLGPLPEQDWGQLPEDSDVDAWSSLPAARTFVHLPAYVEVEAQTWQGMRGRWFFEVKWMVARKPEDGAGRFAGAAGAGAGEDRASGSGSGRRAGGARGPSRRGSKGGREGMEDARGQLIPAGRR